MKKFDTQHSLKLRAMELTESWINGNRSDVANKLAAYAKPDALALAVETARQLPHADAADLCHFLACRAGL